MVTYNHRGDSPPESLIRRPSCPDRRGGSHRARKVPRIIEPGIQRRAEAALEANKHRASPERKGARRYLLSGLVRCDICGFACSERTAPGEGKDYSYYGCMSNRRERGAARRVHPHRIRNVSAPWLEELVWADVKRFVTNPAV